MLKLTASKKIDPPLIIGIGILLATSAFVLKTIAPFLFPAYFLYFIFGIAIFVFFLQIDFEAISSFDKIFYFLSIFLLVLTIIIGRVTRGAVRWIPLGPITIQSAEIARPLLLIFFAKFLTAKEIDGKRLLATLLLFAIPLYLILIQPSLGVAILTAVGFIGVLLASPFEKKYFLWGIGALIVLAPLIWLLLAPYQRQRVLNFLEPARDPVNTGYNAIQSMIAVGSGKLFGRGLGKGVQTQLAFLPERHTDFIFASIAEELGFVGAGVILTVIFFILSRLLTFMESPQNPAARAFLAGLFLTLLAQTLIHVGMNMGIIPITGVPLPLVSAGGSSLLATLMGLAIAVGARSNKS